MHMKIKVENNQKYQGEASEAPRWVRWSVAPWYRRVLVAPTTMYFVVLTGLATSSITIGWENLFLLPSFALLFCMGQNTNKHWYEDRFADAADTD
jgi:hypothetical protein